MMDWKRERERNVKFSATYGDKCQRIDFEFNEMLTSDSRPAVIK
jgi:hypothetical protein